MKLLKVTAHGIRKRRLDVEQDEQHRDQEELHREAVLVHGVERAGRRTRKGRIGGRLGPAAPRILGANQLATNIAPIIIAAVAIVRTTVIRLPSIGPLRDVEGPISLTPIEGEYRLRLGGSGRCVRRLDLLDAAERRRPPPQAARS